MSTTTTEGKEPLVKEDEPRPVCDQHAEILAKCSEGEGCPGTAYPWWNPDNRADSWQVPHQDDLLTLDQMALWAQCSTKTISRSGAPKVMLGTLVRYNPRLVLEWLRTNADYRLEAIGSGT